MKHLPLTTIAAVLRVGWGESQSPEPPTTKAPDIPLWKAAIKGDIEAVKKHLAAGADVNAKDNDGRTSSNFAMLRKRRDIADLLRKHGGKTGEELKAEGK